MSTPSRQHLLVVAAGTGGHIIPGLEVGREWTRDGGAVTYVCGTRPVEARVYQAAKLTPQVVPWPGSARGIADRLRRWGQMLLAVPRAWKLLRRARPDAVLSMGGGFSLPFLGLARMRGIPVFLHESNAVPGKVTRLASRWADRLFLGIGEDSIGSRRKVCGTPVRKMPAPSPSSHPYVVVLGGSQGAQRMYELVITALASVREVLPNIEVHIIGWEKRRVPPLTFPGLHLHEFVPAPADYLAHATLAISRAGSGTLCELAALGVPSLLIPYPHAADHHQHANAEVFAKAGAAVVEQEHNLSADRLTEVLAGLLADTKTLREMEQCARRLHRPDAARDIVRSIRQALTERTPVTIATSILTH